MLSAVSADEYKQNIKTVGLDSASRTFRSREFENKILRRFSKSPKAYQRNVYICNFLRFRIKHQQLFLGYSP